MSKLSTVLGYWCCGPSDTEAGQMARIIGIMSTTFIFGGGVFYFMHNFIIANMDNNEIEYNKSSLPLFAYIATILFSSGALGYITVPIIGHKLCSGSSIYSDQNAITINSEISTNQENYELSGISVTPPPSYDEVVGIQNTRV